MRFKIIGRPICAGLLVITFALLLALPYGAQAESGGELRAVWVATVLNLDYPAVKTSGAQELRRMADEILDGAKDMGFNAVILQVRPSADAIYPSEIFPWSYYLTGEAGRAPDDGFDPLRYWIDGAHSRGMELHAWINPYRVTKNTSANNIESPSGLPAGSPAREHPDWVVLYGDDYYFNPALPEVRELVINGIREILENYKVDGIHLDDYFYPGQDFDDSAAYSALGGGMELAEWRRENVNLLIQGIKAVVDEYDSVRFGVSPGGIWANSTTDERGSATNGGETYTELYADSRRWVLEGWLDYITPQIYWHIGNSRADYAELVSWWSKLVSDTDVKLYIGMAAYRVDGAGEADAWQGYYEIIRQLDLNAATGGIDGSFMFRYGSLAENPPLALAVKDYFNRHKSFTLSINIPEYDIQTDLESYYITGSSDRNHELYLNGEIVENRSENGFFGVFSQLEYGRNVFEFTQNGESVQRVITRVEKYWNYAAAGSVTSCFPTGDYYTQTGYDVELRCIAPVGARVRAEFGGEVYVLYPDTYVKTGITGAETTVYRAVLTLYGESGDISDLGKVIYNVNWRNKKLRVVSQGNVYVVRDGVSLKARAESTVYAYESASTSGGCVNEYAAGMDFDISYISGAFLKLGTGLWVSASDVTVSVGNTGSRELIGAHDMISSGSERISISKKGGAGAHAIFDTENGELTLCVAPADNAPELKLRAGSLFSSVTQYSENRCAYYKLKLKDGIELGGYYVEKTDNGLAFYVNQKRAVKDGAYPLSAHTIIIDAGHGGYDTGTVGFLGSSEPEKMYNLMFSYALKEKLESLGANVIMAREDDSRITLEERVSFSRGANADLFISIHCNNMDYNVDMDSIEGFAVFYRENISADAAESIFNRCLTELGSVNKGLHKQNLYVCRGTWCPSVLYETAFMSNMRDFERLRDPEWRGAVVTALARGIVDYFKK